MKEVLEKKDRIPSPLIFAGLLLLGIGLRFHGLDRALGGGDENEVLMTYVYFPLTHIVTTFVDNYHHVFHTILLHFMAALFGEENEYAIRAPAFISGIACLWLIYKVALHLFASRLTAQVALLIAAVCPVHIYYSQTARGYSLSMFLSILMVYAAIKLLESYWDWKWALILMASGFLMVYTIPINALFVFSLGVWMFCVATVPSLATGFDFPSHSPPRRFLCLLTLFLVIALLSFLAYIPLLHDIFAIAEKRYLKMMVYDSRIDLAAHFIPRLIEKVFPGPLRWFSPFLLIGIIAAVPIRLSYRLLPIFILFVTHIISVIVGAAWQPRSYLFSLPLLVIFLSAGIVWTGRFLGKPLKGRHGGKLASAGLILVYAFISMSIVITEHYPSIKVPDGNLYKQMVRKYSDPLDLLVIADPRNFLYGRTIVKKNLTNIFLQNELTGIKLIATDFPVLDQFKLLDGGGWFKVFQNLYSQEKIKAQDVTGGKEIFSLTGRKSISALPEDFENKSNWKITSGLGEISNLRNNNSLEKHSLLLQANRDADLLIEAPLQEEINIPRDSFAVLFWCGSSRYPALVIKKMQLDFSDPNIYEKFAAFRKQKGKQVLRLGEVNTGMRIGIDLDSAGWNPPVLPVNTLIGKIPAGRYSMSIELNALPGRLETYNCLHLFFIETAAQKE